VRECFLIKPAETETKEAMDDFVDAMRQILNETRTAAGTVSQPVCRLDDVKSAKELNLVWRERWWSFKS